MGQLTTMFYAGILTPTLFTVIVFVIFLVCWFKCNLREKVNELLDGKKNNRKQAGDSTVVANAHFHNYKSRRDNDSIEGSECDSAFDSLHDISSEEWSGSRSGSNSGSRNSPAIGQTQIQQHQQQQGVVGPVVDLLFEVSETEDYRSSHSDYLRAKTTTRTFSSETIDNNLDQKRMSKIPSKDLELGLKAGGCHPMAGAYLVQSPSDNTLVGLSIVSDKLPYSDQHNKSNYMDGQRYEHRLNEHRQSAGDYEYQTTYQHRTGPMEYLAAINLDSTEI